MTTAAMAWDRLDSANKAKVTALLKEHPMYKTTWKSAYHPHKALLPLGKFLMMRASKWPDEIKSKTNINYAYDRPEWHRIVQVLKYDFTIDESNPEVKGTKGDERNIVTAIEYAKISVVNPGISIQLRAVYFSWLINLVGDIHQPLHTCSLFDEDKLKKGDDCGTKIFVLRDTVKMDLHQFWDEQLGTSQDTRRIVQQGFILKRAIPFEDVFVAEMSPVTWAKDGFRLAKNEVYRKEEIPIILDQRKVKKQLSEAYVRNANDIAKRQVALAGYRLSVVISEVLN